MSRSSELSIWTCPISFPPCSDFSSVTPVSPENLVLLDRAGGGDWLFPVQSLTTAWYLCHRIRASTGNDPLEGPTLVGVVEVHEICGGKAKGKGRGYKGN